MGQNQSQSRLVAQVAAGAALVVAEETRVVVGAPLAGEDPALVVVGALLAGADPVLVAQKNQLVVARVQVPRELVQKIRAAIVPRPNLNKIGKEFGDALPSPRNNSWLWLD
jgi:hypothetical protein